MSTLVERGMHATPSVDARALTPLPGRDGLTELRLAGRAMLLLAALTVPIVAVATALNGIPGALGALAGAGLVAVLFGCGGAAQALAVRRGASSAAGVMLAGLGLRIMVYLAALQLLGQLASLHRPSLAMATLVTFVVTLQHEMRVIAKTPQLFWVEAGDRSGERATARPTR